MIDSLLALEQQSHHLFRVRRRREGERKHFVCLVRRDLSALNKTFEKRFPRALPIIKARQKEEEEKKKKRRRRASLLAWSQSPSA